MGEWVAQRCHTLPVVRAKARTHYLRRMLLKEAVDQFSK